MKRIIASEVFSMASALFGVLFIGILTENWGLAAILTLTGYIFWLYYRMLHLEQWISRGTRESEVYDDSGFVGIMIRHLYRQKKTNNERKKRTKEILGRINRNISALPDATILLNGLFEIEWCNEPANYLLNIHGRSDIGQCLTNLIRNPQLLEYLRSPDDKSHLEITSPADSAIVLQIKVVRFGENQYLLTARNVSDQRQLQDGLRNFVANASHELKSPLTVIAGHLELLEDESGLSARGKKSLDLARRQTRRMQYLIEDLLLLSQVESYHLKPDEGDSVSISETMRQVISTLDILDNKGRIECQETGDFYILGIRLEIEGMCMNLVTNALEYSSQEKPVRLQWHQNLLGELIFSVTDQGPGIRVEDLPRLTERYFRGNHGKTSRSTGSGLGLSIVQQAITKHGGLLEIQSERNKGSTFSIIFPSYRNIKRQRKLAPVIRLADY